MKGLWVWEREKIYYIKPLLALILHHEYHYKIDVFAAALLIPPFYLFLSHSFLIFLSIPPPLLFPAHPFPLLSLIDPYSRTRQAAAAALALPATK